MARTARVLHFAMATGLVLLAAIFMWLRQLKMGFDLTPVIGFITAGVALVQLAAVLGILVPRLHIYSAGGHGFGLKKQGTSSDHWIDDFYNWHSAQGFSKQ